MEIPCTFERNADGIDNYMVSGKITSDLLTRSRQLSAGRMYEIKISRRLRKSEIYCPTIPVVGDFIRYATKVLR